MKTRLLIAALAVALSGCATERVMQTGPTYPATAPEKLQFYLTKAPTKPYDEIGRVSVDKFSKVGWPRSGEKVYGLLRQKAASIGGDAVIDITEDFASVSGVVVKMK